MPGRWFLPPMTRPRGMMAHAIREAIDAMASPEIRDRVLTTALEGAGETEIPESGSRLQRFVAQFLGPTLRERLGYDIADAILGMLDPIVARASEEISQVQVRAAAPTAEPPPPSTQRRVPRRQQII